MTCCTFCCLAAVRCSLGCRASAEWCTVTIRMLNPASN